MLIVFLKAQRGRRGIVNQGFETLPKTCKLLIVEGR